MSSHKTIVINYYGAGINEKKCSTENQIIDLLHEEEKGECNMILCNFFNLYPV